MRDKLKQPKTIAVVIIVVIVLISGSYLLLSVIGKLNADDNGADQEYDEDYILVDGKMSFILVEEGSAKQGLAIQENQTLSYKFIQSLNNSESAVISIIPAESEPLKEDQIECYYYYKMSDFGYSGSEVVFTSAGLDEIEGECSIKAGRYLLLLSADNTGWGITLNTEMEGEITINLTADQGVTGALDEYDTLITGNIGETYVEFSYEKDVKNRGLFFKLIEITDEDGQPYLEQNTITTRVITPDNEIFTEDTTEGTTGRIMPSGPMWGWFIFNLDVGNANQGKWRFEGEYQMEGWNREWDITITETYVLY